MEKPNFLESMVVGAYLGTMLSVAEIMLRHYDFPVETRLSDISFDCRGGYSLLGMVLGAYCFSSLSSERLKFRNIGRS